MKHSHTLRISCIIGAGVFVAALLVSSPPHSVSAASAIAPVPRTALAESFVSRVDIYSPYALSALRRLQQELGPERLLVLAYFAWEIPCPNNNGNPLAQCPNPLTSADSAARWNYYQLVCFPNLLVNGTNTAENPQNCWPYGDPRTPAFSDQNVYNGYRQAYQRVSRATSPIQIALTGGIVMVAEDQYRADAQAVLTATDRVTGKSRIWFVLYENNVEALTRDGFGFTLTPTHYDWVVRRAINSAPLTITQSGQQQTAMRSVELDPTWNRENLGVVVFVQKDVTQGQGYEVLQAASLSFAMP